MSTLRHHQLGLLFILLSVVGLLVLTRTQTLASADPRDASFPTVTPTATLPPSEEDWEVAESFDSPLPTPIPTVMPELSRFGRIALHYLAEQREVASETLLIEQEHPRSYPLLGREFMAFTILDTNDGQAFVLLVDTATDEVVDDLATMEQANGEAHFARYGKLDPALYERLQTVDETTQLPVALWVVSDYGDIEEKLHSELAGKYPEVAEALAPNAVWSGAIPPNNWVGTAVVSGSDDISVVIRNDKTGLATFDNGLTPGGATDPAWGLAGAVIHAPALYNNIFGGYSSTFYVQNPNATGANIVLPLFGRTGYGDYAGGAFMGAGNQQVLPIGPIVNNTSWAGSLYGTATQPVAFRIYEEKGSTESRSYNATAVGRHLIYVPAAYRNYYGFNSGLVIQNLHNSSSANVTLRYCERTVTNPANCPTQSVSIPARRAVGVNLNNAPVPNGWSGTVSLQSQSSSIPIAAVVNNTNSVGGYAFNATGYGSKLAIFPRAAKNANGRSTGFTVRNVSGTTIQIIPRYYSADGVQIWWGDALQNTQGQPITLQSAQAIGYFQATDCLPAGLCLPNDWQGSIVLEATGDIVAVMREDTSSTTSGYNGVSR